MTEKFINFKVLTSGQLKYIQGGTNSPGNSSGGYLPKGIEDVNDEVVNLYTNTGTDITSAVLS